MFAGGIGCARMVKLLRECGVLDRQAYSNENEPDYYKNRNIGASPSAGITPLSGPSWMTGPIWKDGIWGNKDQGIF